MRDVAMMCSFLSNKGREDGRGRKGSVSVGIASGRRTLSAGERERDVRTSEGASCHLSISLAFAAFFFFPPLHLFTQIVFTSTPHPFFFKSCIPPLRTRATVVEAPEREDEASKFQISFPCLGAVRVSAVSFHLLYNNSAVYT